MKRCLSCEHGSDIHDADGRCWFTCASGLPETNLVCPCKVDPNVLLPPEKPRGSLRCALGLHHDATDAFGGYSIRCIRCGTVI